MEALQAIAVLQHGGRLVRIEPEFFGQTKYKLFLPDPDHPNGPDIFVGSVTASVAIKLYEAGFLVCPPRCLRKMKDGKMVTDFVLSKPSLSFLEEDYPELFVKSRKDSSCEEVSGE